MKKIILLSLIFFTISSSLKSQEIWFDAGVKAAFGPTLLMNENVMNESHLNQKLSSGYSFGGKFAFNFGYYHGITFDAMYAQSHQGYEITNENNKAFDVKWNTYDLYVMYRLMRTINYMEIGPKFSRVNKFQNNDVISTDNYVEMYPSAVLGFGWYVFGNKAFTGTLGVRIEYAFNDIINSAGKEAGYPVNPYRTQPYDDYKTTNPLFAQLVFEVNWGLGYFSRTMCGGRRHFFSF